MDNTAVLAEFASRRGLLLVDSAVGDAKDRSVYSPDRAYRYAFARIWDPAGPLVLWVGANPGTGDTEERRRPTLERCVARSREDWGAGGLLFGNLFALRGKSPAMLEGADDPVGPCNDEALRLLGKAAFRTIVCWGGAGRLLDRWREAASLLAKPECLGITASGQPRHPLYVKKGTVPMPWPVG